LSLKIVVNVRAATGFVMAVGLEIIAIIEMASIAHSSVYSPLFDN
jgi:hypothetical protein